MPATDAGTTRLVRALLLATLLTRVVAVLWFRTWTLDAGAYEHEVIARALAAGDGFRFNFFGDALQPTGHQAPALPMLLGLGYLLFGIGSAGGRLFAELVLAGLGVVGAWALGRLALEWWGRRAMALAMAGFALYPAFVYLPTRIQAVNWMIPFLLLTTLGFVRLEASRGDARAPRRLAIGTGIVGGLGALGEPILAAPFALCWLLFAWRARAVRATGATAPALRPALVVAAACALTLAPWMLRNAVVLHRLAFVKSSFAYVAWQGNHRGGSGTDKVEVPADVQRALAWRAGGGRGTEALLETARRQAVSVDAALTAADSAELLALPDEGARMRWFGTRLRAELTADPAAYLGVSARRLGMLAWFDPTNPRSFVLAYRLPYLVLAAFALAGVVLLARHGAPSGFGYWTAAALGLVVVHTLIITSARFRLPLEALYLLPAALALDAALAYLFSIAARGTPRTRG